MEKRLSLLYLIIPVLGIAAIVSWAVVNKSYKAGLEEARRANFLACLDESSGDEEACLGRMGKYAWYPRDEAECSAVAKRIAAIFAVEGHPRWSALFRNERCARIGMPHNQEAAAAGSRNFKDRSWTSCYNVDYMVYRCDDLHGRHRRFYDKEDYCDVIGDIALKESFWMWMFENERCWRLGQPHLEPD